MEESRGVSGSPWPHGGITLFATREDLGNSRPRVGDHRIQVWAVTGVGVLALVESCEDVPCVLRHTVIGDGDEAANCSVALFIGQLAASEPVSNIPGKRVKEFVPLQFMVQAVGSDLGVRDAMVREGAHQLADVRRFHVTSLTTKVQGRRAQGEPGR